MSGHNEDLNLICVLSHFMLFNSRFKHSAFRLEVDNLRGRIEALESHFENHVTSSSPSDDQSNANHLASPGGDEFNKSEVQRLELQTMNLQVKRSERSLI